MVNIKQLIAIAEQAGERIMQIYNQPTIAVTHKLDRSVLTQADTVSHEWIFQALLERYPAIPIISEESIVQHPYAARKKWEYFFLVDPLDGTKEFIQRNGEFTVNIALIKQDQPIMGVIYAPALEVIYYAEKDKGAYKFSAGHITKLPDVSTSTEITRVVISRSHSCATTQQYLEELTQQGKEIQTTTAGSALKFGLVAEGLADIYPRFAPTMEWDTAAGHILVNETGKQLHVAQTHQTLLYNKPELINPGFIVR